MCAFSSAATSLLSAPSRQEGMVPMGDVRRFREFARFIAETFPAAYRVADIAGGRGDLAFWLREMGKRPVIIDPRPSTFSRRRIHRALRKEAVRTGRLVHIERQQVAIEDIDLRAFDLLAALHPDEATEPALRVALAHGIDFAIVPCCVFPLDGIKRSQGEWLRYLASLAPDIQTSRLRIAGANIVLWRRSRAADGPDRPVTPLPSEGDRG